MELPRAVTATSTFSLMTMLQSWAQKERTQGGILPHFQYLTRSGERQIGHSPVTVLQKETFLRWEDRLRSRFEWGLISDIQPPEPLRDKNRPSLNREAQQEGVSTIPQGRHGLHSQTRYVQIFVD